MTCLKGAHDGFILLITINEIVAVDSRGDMPISTRQPEGEA